MHPRALGSHNYFAYLRVADADQYYAELKARGAAILSEIETKPWRMREFAVDLGWAPHRDRPRTRPLMRRPHWRTSNQAHSSSPRVARPQPIQDEQDRTNSSSRTRAARVSG